MGLSRRSTTKYALSRRSRICRVGGSASRILLRRSWRRADTGPNPDTLRIFSAQPPLRPSSASSTLRPVKPEALNPKPSSFSEYIAQTYTASFFFLPQLHVPKSPCSSIEKDLAQRVHRKPFKLTVLNMGFEYPLL